MFEDDLAEQLLSPFCLNAYLKFFSTSIQYSHPCYLHILVEIFGKKNMSLASGFDGHMT